jgi:hypothetical protein
MIDRINKAFCRDIYENGTLEFQILRGVRMDLWGLPSARSNTLTQKAVHSWLSKEENFYFLEI